MARRPLPGETFTLSLDQARCVREITTSGRVLDVLVGAAGTGKSTAMAGLRAAWEAEHGAGSVIGLAPSAAAAEVLGEDMGIDADNLAKWLYEHRQRGQRTRELSDFASKVRPSARRATTTEPSTARGYSRLEESSPRWSLRAGQLVVVDEASLASTFALDELMSAALDAGAKVVLVGRPRATLQRGRRRHVSHPGARPRRGRADVGVRSSFQGDVGEGGQSADTSWRRRGSHRLRRPRTNHRGTRDDMLDALYAAWKIDTDQGLHSLMLAGDATTVDELNARARALGSPAASSTPGSTSPEPDAWA